MEYGMHNFNEKITFSESEVKSMEEWAEARKNGLDDSISYLLEALRQVEWIPDDVIPGRLFCPWCNNYRENGHALDCTRQLAITKAQGAKSAGIRKEGE